MLRMQAGYAEDRKAASGSGGGGHFCPSQRAASGA
jgi:hypothetical protein